MLTVTKALRVNETYLYKMNNKPLVYLRTFGCQMNVRDSELICGLLKRAGYKFSDRPENADIIIFNTCSVRQHAEDRVWSEAGNIAKRWVQNKARTANKPMIGLVGCMAEAHKEKVFERCEHVDFVVGPSDIHEIPEIIKKLSVSRHPLYASKIWETGGDIRPEEIYHTGFYQDKEHAYVVISEGCSNFCSYCIVPYVRGRLRNRNLEDILKEIKEAIGKGISRITLLGQNVNAYRSEAAESGPQADFIALLKLVNELDALKEFEFLTSHPKDTSLELFEVMAGLDRLKKRLHLPVQSGSDRILELMNRGYTRKFYLDLAHNYRKIVKNGILTTDIIVGFPTESAQDFKQTMDLSENIRFNSAYIFKYSPRPYVQAAKMTDDVPLAEKERRHRLMLEFQRGISKNKKDVKL
jgi:tRNA-2-methylthio-N6-dimethylallyladenosine synthase